MRTRRAVTLLGTLAALAAAAFAVVLLAGGGDDDEARADRRDPHGAAGRLSRAELAGVLQAAEATAATTPRAELVAEGRALFRSSRLARAGESCQSCHSEGGGANAELGTILHPQREGDFTGPRDPSSLWEVRRTAPYGWDGREPSLEAFVAGTIRSHVVGGATQPTVTTARQAAALTAYLESLRPPETAFDQGTLSEAALRGEALFQGKAGCVDCHGGPQFSDNELHALGVPKASPGDTDTGAATSGPLRGAFSTPSLRDVRNTAPYMHNGALATLEDVVRFYSERSVLAPLDLEDAEIRDLVAYLEAL